MIHYNMRYRGPLEYDKFILNIFQFHNEIHELYVKELSRELRKDNTSYKSLGNYINEIDEVYSYYTGTKTEPGFSEKLYLMLINYKER